MRRRSEPADLDPLPVVAEAGDLRNVGRISTIVWFALLISQVIYLFVGEVTFAGSTETAYSPLADMLSIMAMCSVFAAVCVHAFGVRRGLSAGKFDLGTGSGRRSVFSLLIISWTLCESAAIYGFVLRVLGAPFSLHLQFAIAAGVAHVWIGPWIPALHARE